jgi:hypothetical protein
MAVHCNLIFTAIPASIRYEKRRAQCVSAALSRSPCSTEGHYIVALIIISVRPSNKSKNHWLWSNECNMNSDTDASQGPRRWNYEEDRYLQGQVNRYGKHLLLSDLHWA